MFWYRFDWLQQGRLMLNVLGRINKAELMTCRTKFIIVLYYQNSHISVIEISNPRYGAILDYIRLGSVNFNISLSFESSNCA